MNQLGYYGKISHKGDFVRFNLPQSFINVWDDWLQQVMINGEHHKPEWPTVYANAPAYRFALSSGLTGNHPWIGLFKTSVDKVGRRFPFCLAMSLPEHALPCMSVVSRSAWFDEAESLLARVFDQDYQFDAFQNELADLAERHAVTKPAVNPVAIARDPAADSVTISLLSSHALSRVDYMPVLLDTVIQQTLGEYSIWVASESPGATIISAGLPIDEAGLALFDRQWSSVSTGHIDARVLSDLLAAAPASSAAAIPEASEVTQQKTGSNDASTDGEFTASGRETLQQPVASMHDNEEHRLESMDQVPSADDWAALDIFSESATPEEAPTIPDVEPLELDEDDLPDAPWER